MKKFSEENKNFKEYLMYLMNKSYKQNDLYLAGNYWKYYEKKIIKQIESNDIKNFRSWEGGAGTGGIQSFGGGSYFKMRKFSRNFHPLDNSFNFIDDSIFVQKYNSLINKIIPYISFFKYFLVRIAEIKKYYRDYYTKFLKEKYNYIKNLDENLIQISDSDFGLDEIDKFYINGKIYTSKFLDELLKINYIKKNTDFNSINYIIELGAGIGLLASAFLKLKKNIKYLIIDIPPAICFSQLYLKNIGYKVFSLKDHDDTNNYEMIDLKEMFINYDVICLPTWELPKLKDFKFDLFINVASFQEMEKKQVFNYFSILQKKINKYIYLENSTTGHKKALNKNKFGVLEPVTYEEIESYLLDNYKIRENSLGINSNQVIFERKN